MLKVALLVPESTRTTRVDLVGARTEYYGSPAGWQITDDSLSRRPAWPGGPFYFCDRVGDTGSQGILETWAKQRDFASYAIDLLL